MHGVKSLPIKKMWDATESSFPTGIPPSQTEPGSAGNPDHGQLLLRVSIYEFSQLALGDQLQMIEEMLSMKEVKGVVIKTPAEADGKDCRIRTFPELFDKLPQFSRVLFFKELAQKFFQRELVFWFRLLCSHDQQKLIKVMLDDGSYSRGDCTPAPSKPVGCNNIMLGMEPKFRKPLWKQLRHNSAFRLRTFIELVSTVPWYWEGFSRLWELSGNEEIKNIRAHQSCYAEFFLASAIMCIKARCIGDAGDRFEALLGKSECNLIQNWLMRVKRIIGLRLTFYLL